MLLTGFDAPILKGMYFDRNLKDHNLLQAIARVNRPEDGNNGLIVDYRGALSNLEDALEFDDDVIEEEIVAEEGELLSISKSFYKVPGHVLGGYPRRISRGGRHRASVKGS